MTTRERKPMHLFFQEYEVLNLLGKGGYGSVYRARCLRSGMEIAIKMVIVPFWASRDACRSSCITAPKAFTMSFETSTQNHLLISARFDVLGKRIIGPMSMFSRSQHFA